MNNDYWNWANERYSNPSALAKPPVYFPNTKEEEEIVTAAVRYFRWYMRERPYDGFQVVDQAHRYYDEHKSQFTSCSN